MRLWITNLGITEGEALVRAKRYLREAQKQPTALSRQAAGYVLLYRGSYKEALVEFKEAIAQDRGDSWSYAFAALALTSLGKPSEAMPYINAALRLDPRPPPVFLYILGLTQLSLKQFENAASSLGKAVLLNPDDQYPFLALGAAFGHLGRMQKAVDAIARYNELEVAQGGLPATLSGCACGLGENKQLKEGLRLAGVPENLFRGAFAEKNRLKEGKIRSLIFGQRLHGRSRNTGVERSASVTKDGVAAMSGDWVTGIFPLSDGAASFIDGDLYLEFAGQRYYGPVFRNPGGTRAMKNEYIWHLNEPFGFSVVK
jgi:tetratricopeptide (TPR) repeat protein